MKYEACIALVYEPLLFLTSIADKLCALAGCPVVDVSAILIQKLL